MSFPEKVTIFEVSPRDGLQNEKEIVPTAVKIEYINRLSQTGLSVIETTSFVSPKWVPQMADPSEIMRGIKRHKNVRYPVLIPNRKGLETALTCNIQEIAVFTAASETFNQKNINCSIDESLERIREIIELAKQHNIRIRGYVSCVLGCPYEGAIDPAKVANIASRLITLGCYQISLGDTIGVGTADKSKNLIDLVHQQIPLDQIAVHFHDTYGQALTNIYACLEKGITTIDSSAGGLGGCPYAPGAGGNVATEDVVYLLNGLGIDCGVDLKQLIEASQYILGYLGHTTHSKVARAFNARSI